MREREDDDDEFDEIEDVAYRSLEVERFLDLHQSLVDLRGVEEDVHEDDHFWVKVFVEEES
jgi:hypothetical protein